ncbi:ArsR/SmtB family transcription factor [Paenarthrobacter sp. NPDC089675]|uniref:ArsR/SmtB family transcription factor n=1 Tax=Paenarthrobacter sp. NPDC089675 TaxID=3364376 RepID=UPI00380A092D
MIIEQLTLTMRPYDAYRSNRLVKQLMGNDGRSLEQPDIENVQILDVLKALGDRTRLVLVAHLANSAEKACGTFPVDVTPSTLSHHFKILREAGIIHQREVGRQRMTSLRRDELDTRFPGLLGSVLQDTFSGSATSDR